MIDLDKPLPDEIFYYRCRNCDDDGIYETRKDALYQCWRHDHKSGECKYEKHMDITHYKKVEDIPVNNDTVLGED